MRRIRKCLVWRVASEGKNNTMEEIATAADILTEAVEGIKTHLRVF